MLISSHQRLTSSLAVVGRLFHLLHTRSCFATIATTTSTTSSARGARCRPRTPWPVAYYRLPGESAYTSAYYCGVPRPFDAELRPPIPFQALVQPGLQVHSGHSGEAGLRFDLSAIPSEFHSPDQGITLHQVSPRPSAIALLANQGWSSGRHYFELEVLSGGTSPHCVMIGITSSSSLSPSPSSSTKAHSEGEKTITLPPPQVSGGNIKRQFPGTRGTSDGLFFHTVVGAAHPAQPSSSNGNETPIQVLGVEAPYSGDKLAFLLDFYYGKVSVFKQSRFLWEEAEGQLVLQEGVTYFPVVVLGGEVGQKVTFTNFEKRA